MVRGGGIPTWPLAFMPIGRMGPPLRSFAADAHDCIMVQVLRPTGYKVVARFEPRPKAGSPLIVIPTAPTVIVLAPQVGLARAEHAARLGDLDRSWRVGVAKLGSRRRNGLQIEQETNKGQKYAPYLNLLTKKAPYKGLGADSEEKHEPASDIDTAAVDSLKVLDPNVWTRRALQEKAVRLGCTVLHQCIRPRIGAHAPDHHGNPRASDLINGHASKGSWGHQFSGALERPFLHLVCFSRRPRWEKR